MAQTINTNIASLNAQRNLSTSQTTLATSLQRLSSGLRINSAKDDAAGMAISERFSTQIRGLNQATRNANDGISLAQTGEGALSAVTDNLQRIRELAVQSANSTNSAADRVAINLEVQQRLAEIDRTASQTSFNGTKLLDGSFASANFQIGANAGEVINVAVSGNTRLSETGAIATTSTSALGAAGSGGKISKAVTFGDFSQMTSSAVSGSATILAPAVLNYDATAAGLGQNVLTSVAADMSGAGGAATFAKLSVGGVAGVNMTATATSARINNLDLAQDWTTEGGHFDFSVTDVDGGSVNISLTTDLADATAVQTAINAQLSAANAQVRVAASANTGTPANVDLVFSNTTTAGVAVTGPTVGGITMNVGSSVYVSGGGLADPLAADVPEVDTNGDAGGAFTFTEPDGTTTAVALTGDYSAGDAAAFTLMATHINTALAGTGVAVTSTGVGNLTFTNTTSGVTTNDMAFAVSGGDAQATTALAADVPTFTDGAPASLTSASTIIVDGLAPITLSGNYADDTSASVGVGGNSMVQDLQAALNGIAGNNGKYLVSQTTAGAGQFGVTIARTATHATPNGAVVVTAGAGQAGANATVNGLTGGASTPGAAGGGGTNATFTLDGAAVSITLDQNYASITDLATGHANSIQAQLNTASAGTYTVSVDASSNIVINKTAIGDTAFGASASVSNAATLLTGATTAVGHGATSDSSVTFNVDSHAVTLTGNYTTTAQMAAGLQAALVSGYTVVEDPAAAGSLLITNTTNGSSAVSITASGGDAVAAGIANGTYTGTDGAVGGSISLSDFTLNGVDLSGSYGTATVDGATALATAINTSVSGVYATVAAGIVTMSSSAAIELEGAVDTVAMGLTAGTVAADSGSLADANVLDADEANTMIQRIDSAMNAVSNLRSTFGAIQNRFESVISSLTATSENLTSARSRIQDADFAAETAALTRNQILQQAGIAMLAQANALPNQVLTLLRG